MELASKRSRLDAPRTGGDTAFGVDSSSATLLSSAILTPKTSGLGHAVAPLVSGDAAKGNAIYRGEFAFAGVTVQCRGTVVFDCESDSRAWREWLHGFGWIEDVKATGRELHRLHARALIADWIANKRHAQSPANAIPVATRRVITWIASAPYLCEGATEGFRTSFLTSLARQVRDLQLRLLMPGSTSDRLGPAIALAYASIGLRGLEGTRQTVFTMLGNMLDRQVLPDGGHVSRNPQVLVKLLLDLLPIRITCEAARIELPAALHGTLERMLPMVRFFLLGDGGIATFQGVDDPMVDECRAILDADRVKGKPVTHAAHSGFGRLDALDSAVVCSLGEPADLSGNPLAGHDALAFEFSYRSHRIVINCGTPAVGDRETSQAGRTVEAHSTVTLNEGKPVLDMRSGLIGRCLGWMPGERSGHEPPRFQASPVGSVFEARARTSLSDTGVAHARSLFLSARGNDLRGEDRFAALAKRRARDVPFAIRFHLDPSVTASLPEGASAVKLLVGGEEWKFSARGAGIAIEESVRLSGRDGPRSTRQIVLRGEVAEDVQVVWAFKRLERIDDPPAPEHSG